MNTLVLEHTENGDMPVDVYQKLANDRILFISDHINDQIAIDIAATLMLLDSEDCENKITLFINSSSSDIRSVFSILDVMNMIASPISTICTGSCNNEASLILMSGTPGLRFATKHAFISVSQLVHDWCLPHTNMTDAKNLMTQFQIDNKRILDIIANTTGKTLKQVKKDFGKEVFFTSPQARKYGFIDKVIGL